MNLYSLLRVKMGGLQRYSNQYSGSLCKQPLRVLGQAPPTGPS